MQVLSLITNKLVGTLPETWSSLPNVSAIFSADLILSVSPATELPWTVSGLRAVLEVRPDVQSCLTACWQDTRV